MIRLRMEQIIRSIRLIIPALHFAKEVIARGAEDPKVAQVPSTWEK